MHKKIYLSFIIILCLAFATTINATDISKVGTSGAQFLKIGVGARAAGMGYAFTAVANDATALYWNPAGIAWFNKSKANVSYADWFADIKYNYVGVAFPFSGNSAIGLQVIGLSMGDMEETTLESPEGTGRNFSASDLALGVTYARRMTDKVSLGLTVKMIHQSIWEMTANAFAIDAGTTYKPSSRVTVAMNISNLGTSTRFTGGNLTQRDPLPNDTQIITNKSLETFYYELPTTFRIAAAYQTVQTENFSLLTSVDGVHWNDNYEQLNLGFEFTFLGVFALRGGYNYMPEHNVKWLDLEREQQQNWTTKTEFDAGLNFGFGLTYDLGGLKGNFDYSWSQYNLLDNVNRFSLGISF